MDSVGKTDSLWEKNVGFLSYNIYQKKKKPQMDGKPKHDGKYTDTFDRRACTRISLWLWGETQTT